MTEELDGKVAALEAELAEVKADAERRIESQKRQKAEAKERARTIIQKQKEESLKQINALKEENHLQAEEIKQVKDLLRSAETEKTALESEAVVLKNEVRSLTIKVKSLSEARDESEALARDVRQQVDIATRQSEEQRSQFEQESSTLRIKLEAYEQAAQNPEESANGGGTVDVSAEILRKELDLSRKRAEELQQDCDEAQSNLRKAEEEHAKSSKALRDEESQAQASLSSAKQQVTELQNKLEEITKTLEEERKSNTEAVHNLSNSNTEGDEAKKILEAKVAEMERVVVAKQSEIGKVREKARTYLKELNAEKREMEEKSKEQADTLRAELEREREKLEAADQRVDKVEKEVDDCLNVIREKQKSVQVLKMTVNSYKKAVEDANAEAENVRADFARYKERARLALQEKETVASSSQADVEAATDEIRQQLEKARSEILQLRKTLSATKVAKETLDVLEERAERAEAAAELLRSGAPRVTASTYSQVDQLHDHIAFLESNLSAARSSVGDNEARHATTKMRLEATEKALQTAELRAQQSKRASLQRVKELEDRMDALKLELQKSHEAAAAAQRTAAAAGRAMSFSTPDKKRTFEPGDRSLLDQPVQTYEETEAEEPLAVLEFDDGSRQSTSLTKAIQGHSKSMGLDGIDVHKSPKKHEATTNANDELNTKDQHIAVLTSQVAEFGTLLDEMRHDSELRAEQTELLKAEVKNLDAKLASAEKLQNGAPFSYLRTIVVRYLETEDPTLLPVIANVLSFSEEETTRVKTSTKSKNRTNSSAGTGGYFSIPFLGSK